MDRATNGTELLYLNTFFLLLLFVQLLTSAVGMIKQFYKVFDSELYNHMSVRLLSFGP